MRGEKYACLGCYEKAKKCSVLSEYTRSFQRGIRLTHLLWEKNENPWMKLSATTPGNCNELALI